MRRFVPGQAGNRRPVKQFSALVASPATRQSGSLADAEVTDNAAENRAQARGIGLPPGRWLHLHDSWPHARELPDSCLSSGAIVRRISMAGWQDRAECGPRRAGLELEAHPLLLQVSNQHFSVLAALRCACPVPPCPMIVTLLTVCCKRCLQERWPGPGGRGERGDSDCCAVLCCAAQGSCPCVC